MKRYSILLLRASAIFGVIGTFLGAHMAGATSYAFLPIHAHMLVVGWLSLFSFAIFYRVFHQGESFLAKSQVWTALIGTIGLVVGMIFQFIDGIPLPKGVTLTFYIAGGMILLISYILFVFLTFMVKKDS